MHFFSDLRFLYPWIWCIFVGISRILTLTHLQHLFLKFSIFLFLKIPKLYRNKICQRKIGRLGQIWSTLPAWVDRANKYCSGSTAALRLDLLGSRDPGPLVSNRRRVATPPVRHSDFSDRTRLECVIDVLNIFQRLDLSLLLSHSRFPGLPKSRKR